MVGSRVTIGIIGFTSAVGGLFLSLIASGPYRQGIKTKQTICTKNIFILYLLVLTACECSTVHFQNDRSSSNHNLFELTKHVNSLKTIREAI